MPAWWDSVDAVSTFTWWMRWVAVVFTVLAAISGSVVLLVTKRGDTLKAERDAKAQAELVEKLRRRQERRTFRLSEEMKAALRAAPAEINRFGIR